MHNLKNLLIVDCGKNQLPRDWALSQTKGFVDFMTIYGKIDIIGYSNNIFYKLNKEINIISDLDHQIGSYDNIIFSFSKQNLIDVIKSDNKDLIFSYLGRLSKNGFIFVFISKSQFNEFSDHVSKRLEKSQLIFIQRLALNWFNVHLREKISGTLGDPN
ncbi:MAG: hypothetical protein HeimC3_35870 [Candidatus Heimdallarchaeota archaeon LC_3]|nr:MAG: hypothetical protein HeimC3_35870 [Candidatus Heimdallarchaeota archaeon LC_3]